MTIEEQVAIYEMRLRGFTMQECADRFGVTREYIRQLVPATQNRCHRKIWYEECIFPNIANWLYDNRYTYNRFGLACGTNGMSMRRYLIGEVSIPRERINRILDVTGMTYEEAFYEEKKAAPSVADSKAAQENNLS